MDPLVVNEASFLAKYASLLYWSWSSMYVSQLELINCSVQVFNFSAFCLLACLFYLQVSERSMLEYPIL